MDAGRVFKGAMAPVRAAMKGDGFFAKGATFWRLTSEGNTALISLQKSATATSAELSVQGGFDPDHATSRTSLRCLAA